MPDTSGSGKKAAGNSKSKGKNKRKSLFPNLITIVSVLLVILVILGGAFYIIIHNNVNNLAEKYRYSINNMPLVRLALPAAKDPSDPENMTAGEIKQKYVEYRDENANLKKQIDELQKEIEALKPYKDEYDKLKSNNEQTLKDISDKQAALDDTQKKLEDTRGQLAELIKSNDISGFKQYYEALDPDTAKTVYNEVIKQQQVNTNLKNFAGIYEAMDPSAAAQIFEQMGSSRIDTIAQTLKAMKTASQAEILASMDPAFASAITEKLNALYAGN